MAEERPVRSQTLAILRELRDWTQEELAAAAGLKRATIGAYERGVETPSDRKLLQFAAVMGYTEEKVREVLWLLRPPVRLQGRWVGPVYFSAAEEREIWDLGSDSSRLAAIHLRGMLARGHAQAVVAKDREAALALWDDLRAERRLRTAVREKKEYQSWAVVELLCQERRSGNCGFWGMRRRMLGTRAR
jgi:transcriptional regulator with XRE-family HTH domain